MLFRELGVDILRNDTYPDILERPAIEFLAELARNFSSRRDELISARCDRQKAYDEGGLPDFLPETREVRESEWTVAAIPESLLDRRVEITGPPRSKNGY